jgi:hypothetical protein
MAENPSAGGESARMFVFLDNEEFQLLINNHTWKVNHVDRTSEHTGTTGRKQNQVPMEVEGSGEAEADDRTIFKLITTVLRDEIARTPRRQLKIVQDYDLADGAVQFVAARCRLKWEVNAAGQTDTLKLPFTYFCDINDAVIPEIP